MSGEKITININDKGEMRVESNGIKGPSCLGEVNKLIEDLAYITSISKTDEYYQDDKVKVLTKDKVVIKK